MLLTRRLHDSIQVLDDFMDLEQPDERYIVLSRLATSYIKDMLAGKTSRSKRLAIQLQEDQVTEYLNGLSVENLSKMILDLGKMRKSLA